MIPEEEESANKLQTFSRVGERIIGWKNESPVRIFNPAVYSQLGLFSPFLLIRDRPSYSRDIHKRRGAVPISQLGIIHIWMHKTGNMFPNKT